MREELHKAISDVGIYVNIHLPLHDQLDDEVIPLLPSLPLKDELFQILKFRPDLALLLKDKLDSISLLHTYELLEYHPELIEYLNTRNLTMERKWKLIKTHPKLIKHIKELTPPHFYDFKQIMNREPKIILWGLGLPRSSSMDKSALSALKDWLKEIKPSNEEIQEAAVKGTIKEEVLQILLDV